MNKEKIIKDLKERNDKLVDQRRQFEARLYHEQYLSKEKDKEIERLNNIIKQKDNIINELESYIKHYDKIEGYYEYVECGYDEYNSDEDVKEQVLDYIKELKEDK